MTSSTNMKRKVAKPTVPTQAAIDKATDTKSISLHELRLKTKETTALLRDVNDKFGCAMRVHVQLYNGEYVDAEYYNYTKLRVLHATSELSSGTICSTKEWYGNTADCYDKERQQLMGRCAIHLAVTREANLKFFMLEDNGDPMFYVV